jgi:arylsulfatase A-like enzyme
MRNTEIIERPANQHTITKRYTEEAIAFIKDHKEEPFFVYLAHSLPHIPLFASEKFRGTSDRGLYGDVIEEIDHGVGQLIATLKEEGLDVNTIVIFTSDNGPWLSFKSHAGSAGLLEGRKRNYLGRRDEGALHLLVSRQDQAGSSVRPWRYHGFITTFSKMAGVPIPEDRVIDGYDLTHVLLGNEPSPRENMLYYRGTDLYAIRLGDYKAHYITQGEYGMFGGREEHNPPILYIISQDPSEQYNIAEDHPEILKNQRFCQRASGKFG